ncbi:MAG: hypothetical protein JXR07_09755 [Reichenbachiella sp.]
MSKSDKYFLGATLASFVLSVYLWFSGDKDSGLYVGIWVPSIISLAIFFKMSSKNRN